VASRDLKIEAAFATLPLPGQSESGDLCLVKRVGKGTLIAVVDAVFVAWIVTATIPVV